MKSQPLLCLDKTPATQRPPSADNVHLIYDAESGALKAVDSTGDVPFAGASVTPAAIVSAAEDMTDPETLAFLQAIGLADEDGNLTVSAVVLGDTTDDVLGSNALATDFRGNVVLHDDSTPGGVVVAENRLRFVGRTTFAASAIDSAAEVPAVTIATIPISAGEASPGTIYELQGRAVFHHAGSTGCVAVIGFTGQAGYASVPDDGIHADALFGYQKAATSLSAGVDLFIQASNSSGTLVSVASQPIPAMETLRSTSSSTINAGTVLASGGGAMPSTAQNLYLVVEAQGATGATALSVAWDLTLRIIKP